MSELLEIWRDVIADHSVLEHRPDFRFDPDFYTAKYPDLTGDPAALRRHYVKHGKEEGRYPTRFRDIHAEYPDVTLAIERLVINPRIRAVMEKSQLDAVELAFELMRIGHDAEISNFSASHYRASNPDVAEAGMDPLEHYVVHGIRENRPTLENVRSSQYAGARRYDPSLPTVLITAHELSNTGAPHVTLDLAREAAETHNVVIASLRPGPLLQRARETACQVVVTANPHADFLHLLGDVFRRIDVAIVNSVESHPFIKMLVGREIPYAAYVHEYVWYTFPTFKTIHTALFADLLVFSSEHVRDSWSNVFDDIEFDRDLDLLVLPQRELTIGSVDADRLLAARQRLSKLIRRDVADKRIVCGAGHAQWRKGTDIFVMTAQIARHRDPDTIFVWVGDGIDFEDVNFGAWMTHHLNEVRAGEPDGNLFFLPAGDHYLDVLAASDAMLMSSRLDPLPNVAFDAMSAGCHIVVFEGGTGFNDPVYRRSGYVTSVEFANPEAAATALLALPRKAPGDGAIRQAATTNIFTTILRALSLRVAGRRRFVVGATPLDEPVLYTACDADRPLRVREREKLFTNQRRYLWRDADDARAQLARSDNWVHQSCSIVEYADMDPGSQPEYSLHLHAYYVTNLHAELGSLLAYRHAKRIVITTDSDEKHAVIDTAMGSLDLSAEVRVVPNLGRDILPFLQLFGPDGPAGSGEIWAHLHQKKSATSGAQGDVWRRFLTAILLGGPDRLSTAVHMIGQDGVGLVTAFDPFFGQWNANRDLLHTVEGKFSGPLPHNPLTYPTGNMFWVRSEVAHAMNALFAEDHAWSNEPLANDGTEFHLMERLWPAVTAELGLTSLFISKSDQKRRV